MTSPGVLFPRRAEGVLARKGAEEFVLLDPESGAYFTLDEIGGRIWELCDGTRPLDEIAAILAGEYDAPREMIATDVKELIEDLARENLVGEAR
jgi:coenzyme PQQ biosynthesis protein PqqD